MQVFLRWWIDQLIGLLPAAVARRIHGPRDAVMIEPGGDYFTVLIRSRGRISQLAQAPDNPAGLDGLSEILKKFRRAPALLLLRLPQSTALQKQLSVPSTAKHDLEDLLGFEIERLTPFTRDEIYWSYALLPGGVTSGQIDVQLSIIPRAQVDSVSARLQRAGIVPNAIELDTPAAIRTIRIGKPPRVRVKHPITAIALAASGMALIATTPLLYDSWAIADADATLASLEPQAREAISLRQTADRAKQAVLFLNNADTKDAALAKLAAVTRVIPDDAYLTALSFHGRGMTLSGFSASAADLVVSLSRSPAVRNPTLDSPVTKAGGDGLERFTISATLAGGETK